MQEEVHETAQQVLPDVFEANLFAKLSAASQWKVLNIALWSAGPQ